MGSRSVQAESTMSAATGGIAAEPVASCHFFRDWPSPAVEHCTWLKLWIQGHLAVAWHPTARAVKLESGAKLRKEGSCQALLSPWRPAPQRADQQGRQTFHTTAALARRSKPNSSPARALARTAVSWLVISAVAGLWTPSFPADQQVCSTSSVSLPSLVLAFRML
jgi:hypothetical protein